MKRLIIFDLDDTFYEYESTHKSALEKVFRSKILLTTIRNFIKIMKIQNNMSRTHWWIALQDTLN